MRHLLLLSLLFCALPLLAEQKQGPVVHPDHSVTITLDAPDAKHVSVEGSFSRKPLPMQQIDGLWTLHLDSLPAELYTYRYKLGRKKYMLDPAREQWMRDVDVMWNYFVVEDSLTQLYLDHDEVAHGTLEYVWYPSTLNGMSQRRMAIYLPLQYVASDTIALPVLYLLHGSGGDETTWSDCGCVCQILDNMFSRGLAKPCIVVMPNGIAELDAAPGESPWMSKEPTVFNPTSMTGMIESAFVKEIVGFVDRKYRTLADREHRAIAGLSLGGLHAIFITANHPGLFDYVGLFSAQSTNMLDDERKQLMIARAKRNSTRLRQAWGLMFNFQPDVSVFDEQLHSIKVYSGIEEKLARMAQQPPKVYYMAIGKEDKLLKFNQLHKERLDKAGIPYEFHLTEGAHDWSNWRRYLVEFLPKIF